MRLTSHLVSTAAACMLAFSCSRAPMLHTYHHTPSDGWALGDTLTYRVDTVTQSGTYDVEVGVRTTDAFPYKKLWLIVESSFVNPQESRTDSLECVFVNSHEDRNGKGTGIYQYNFPLRKARLTKGQSGIITIRHIMRREVIPGISDIGIKISR